MKKVSFILSIILFVCVVICCFLYFFSIDGELIRTYNVNGASFVLYGSCIIMAAASGNIKKLFYISNIYTLFGFGFTFYSLYDLYSTYPEVNDKIVYYYGFGLYIVCFILLIINFIVFVKLNKKVKLKEVDIPDELKKFNIDNNYILVNYVYGFGKRPELYGNLSIIKDDKTSLQFYINSDEVFNSQVMYDNITGVIIDKNILLNTKIKKANDNEFNRQMFAISVFGTWGPLVAKYSLNNVIDDYENTNFNEEYDIQINYVEYNEDKKLMFSTRKDPCSFFDNISLLNGKITKK